MTIMIETLLWLVGYQLAGELISRTSLPLPGPVLGMLLLFATLALRKSVPESMKLNVPRFLSHLSLLFIPAGAAVLAYRDLLAGFGWQLIVVLVLSTTLTLLLPGLLLKLLLARHRHQEGA
jgi:holin-like protein